MGNGKSARAQRRVAVAVESASAKRAEGYPPQDPGPVKGGTGVRVILPNTWVHLTTRTLDGRYAFLPKNKDFTARVWGIVGMAMKRYGVQVSMVVLLGNHYHMLARACGRNAISLFMQWVNSRLAGLTNELNDTRGTVWDHHYASRNLLDDEAIDWWFRYGLSHATKESICPSPTLWPGPHSAQAHLSGEPVAGAWLERPRWVKAGKPEDRAPFLIPVEVTLTPLPRWERRPASEWQAHCRAVVDDIVLEYAHLNFVGVSASLERGVHYRPETLKRSTNRTFDARGPSREELLADHYKARRESISALLDLNRRLIQAGHTALLDGGDDATPPEGTDWHPLLADALEDRAIIAPFPIGHAATGPPAVTSPA